MVKKKPEEQIEALQKQVDEWKSKCLRALADYQNLERRVSEERLEQRERIVEEIMHSVLLLLDNMQLAQKHLQDEGLANTIKHFDATLAYYQIKKIEVLRKPFNPHEMECIEVVESDKDNEVAEELRPGYMIGNKVLRVAQVKVGKQIKKSTNDESVNIKQ